MLGILASMFDGLLVGCVYGLAAMGLGLIWGVMNVINLAHGGRLPLACSVCISCLTHSASMLTCCCYRFRGRIPLRNCHLLDCRSSRHRPSSVDELAIHLRGEPGPDRVRHYPLDHQSIQHRFCAAGDHPWPVYVHRRPHCRRNCRRGYRHQLAGFSSLHAFRQGDSAAADNRDAAELMGISRPKC